MAVIGRPVPSQQCVPNCPTEPIILRVQCMAKCWRLNRKHPNCKPQQSLWCTSNPTDQANRYTKKYFLPIQETIALQSWPVLLLEHAPSPGVHSTSRKQTDRHQHLRYRARKMSKQENQQQALSTTQQHCYSTKSMPPWQKPDQSQQQLGTDCFGYIPDETYDAGYHDVVTTWDQISSNLRNNNEIVRMAVAMRLEGVVIDEVSPVDIVVLRRHQVCYV